MRPGDVRGGGAYLELYQRVDKLIPQLNQSRTMFFRWASSIAAGITTILGPVAAINLFSNYGDNAAKAAKKLQVNVQQLQEMRHAAGLAGIEVQRFDDALNQLNKASAYAASGNQRFTVIFEKLGVNAKNFLSLGLNEKLITLRDSLAKLSQADQTFVAFKLFGDSAGQITSFLKDTNFEEAAAEARLLGVVLGDEAAGKAELLNDTLSRLYASVKGLSLAFASSLVDTVVDMITWVTSGIVVIRQLWQESDRFRESLASLAKIGGIAVGIFGAIFIATNAAFIAFALVTLSVIAFVEAMGIADTGVESLFRSIRVGGQSTAGWWDRLGDAMANSFLVLWDVAKLTLMGITNFFKDTVDRIILYYTQFKSLVGIGEGKTQQEIEVLKKETEEKITGRKQEVDDLFEQNKRDEAARRKASDELFKEDAETIVENPFKTLQERVKAVFDKLSATPTLDTSAISDGLIQGVPETVGIKGFFGGSYGAQHLGEALGGGVSTQEKQLNTLESIDGRLNEIANNTKNNLVSSFQGD